MQEGALCHTKKSVEAFRQSQNIPLLDWPDNSPDVNPIENMWELVKKMEAEGIKTKTEFIETLRRV